MERILLFLAIGLTIGSISGALGIGGGVLLVPALIWLCGFDPKQAAGTSLAILIPPIGLPAAWKYYVDKRMDLEAALWIAGSFAVGAYLSASLVHYLPERVLRLAFGLVMIYVAVRFMLHSDKEAATAAVGLTAVAFAWLSYLGLRLLGRRHLVKPDLGQQVRAMQEQGRGDIDYHI
jgi:uncharacterized membrane protein YfcA